MTDRRGSARLARLLWFAVIAGLFCGLLSLGFWQLQRGAEKAQIQEAYQTRTKEPALAVQSTLLDPQSFEYYRAQASGTWDARQTILIDNRIVDGRPGYHVITPLVVDGIGTRLLVNRGWIPWPADRGNPPTIEAPRGTVAVTGLLKKPADDFYTLESEPPRLDQPVWQNLDMQAFRDQVEYPLQPMILLLDADADGGYLRRWPVVKDEWIARHRGYALQWFGLAAALLVLSILLLVRSTRSTAAHPRKSVDD